MNKGIWAGLVAIAFVAGSITTGTMAYAASNAQGQPFQQLRDAIDEISSSSFTVDSFFDVFYDIELSSSSCPEGEVPKVDRDLQATTCVPETALTPDSFFDVFYDIETDVGIIQTEIVPLQLHSVDPTLHLRQDCGTDQVLKWNDATGQWECAADIDIDTTYDGTDFALSNQPCPRGERVSGVDATGAIICSQITGIDIARGSISTTQIAADAVRSFHIIDQGITTADIAAGAITNPKIGLGAINSAHIQDDRILSVDIADGTIRSDDIDTSQIQKRVSGSCFAAGQSIKSISASGTVTCETEPTLRVSQVSHTVTIPAGTGDASNTRASCPDGTTLIGGGLSISPISTNADIQVRENGPSGNSWNAAIEQPTSNPSAFDLTAVAICMTFTQ